MICTNCGYNNSESNKRCIKCNSSFNFFTDYNDPSKNGIPSFFLRNNKEDSKLIRYLYYGLFVIFLGFLIYFSINILTR
jgi:hypothetical protein